jgi:hypothetical protein
MELHSPEYKWVTTAQHKENGLHQYCTPKLNSRNCKINTLEVFIVMKFTQQEASSEMSGLETSSRNCWSHGDKGIFVLSKRREMTTQKRGVVSQKNDHNIQWTYYTLTNHHYELKQGELIKHANALETRN